VEEDVMQEDLEGRGPDPLVSISGILEIPRLI